MSFDKVFPVFYFQLSSLFESLSYSMIRNTEIDCYEPWAPTLLLRYALFPSLALMLHSIATSACEARQLILA